MIYLASEFAGRENCTEGLQRLIDDCAAKGGGQVRLTAGIYRTATLELKSGVHLYLDAAARVMGVEDCHAYTNRYWEVSGRSPVGFHSAPSWYNALICAYDQQDVGVEGHGLIDGCDCADEGGEQGFRGPHGVFFFRCRHILVQGVSIARAGNYATMYEECEHARIDHVRIFGGQDAMRLFRCSEFDVTDCDFRTGDDCVSGPMNRNLRFENCFFNTPGGHTFLMGCVNLHVKRCKLWGQGEYPATFKEKKRYSNSWTGFAMLHDKGDPNEMLSDNWLIEDVELENIETVFRHDRTMYFQDGHVGRVVIDGIRAKNFIYPITLSGKEGDPICFTLRNGTFVRRTDDERKDCAFLRASHFAAVTLENVTVENCDEANLMSFEHGGAVTVRNLYTRRAAAAENAQITDVGEANVISDEARTSAGKYVQDAVDSIYVPIGQTEEFRGPRSYIQP